MICCFPTFAGDVKQLLTILQWIKDLGACKPHDCLIVADSKTPYQEVNACRKVATEVFREVRLVSTSESVSGWVAGANSLFRTACAYVKNQWPQPFLWMESDACPLKPVWLDAIESEYLASGKRYMGHIYDSNNPQLPKRVMSGIAVYFPDAFSEIPWAPQSPRAFDCDYSPLFVENGVHTNLVHHIWGTPGDPPRFSSKAVPGTSMFDLNSIPKEAVVFHRVKNGSLIRELRKAMGINPEPEVVYTQQTFIQLGRFGDLILLLPAFRYIFEKTGFKPRVMASTEFSSVLAGASYIEPCPAHYHWWNQMPEARAKADRDFGGGIVTQCYAMGWGIELSKWPNFMASMHERTGVPLEEMMRLPLVFDQRDSAREAKLLKTFRITDKPMLLFNFTGHSSPFPHTHAVRHSIQKFAGKFELIDLGSIHAPYIFDLLGFMDAAAAGIYIDSATLHLAHASAKPYCAFTQDGWTGSTPRGNVAIHQKYHQAGDPQRLGELETWLRNL